MIQIASVGYGDIAQRRFFPELAKLADRVRLTAIAGRNEARLKEAARRLGVSKTYTDVDRMLADDEIDAVLVLTPPSSHGEIAVKCVEAGKHVLLEKPMVKTIDEAKRIVAAVEKSPVVFMALPYVDSPAHKTLRRLLAQKAIGEVTNIECHISHRGPTHADWFYKKEIAGGGVLFDLGIYALANVADLFGPAQRLRASYDTQFETRTMDDGTVVRPDVEDIVLIHLWLEQGPAVTVNANWNGWLTHLETRFRIAVFGREGSIHFGARDGSIYVHRHDGKYRGLAGSAHPDAFDGYPCMRVTPEGGASRTITEHFVELVEKGDTSILPLKRQVHVMEIMLAAYEQGGLSAAYELKTRF